MRAYAYVEKVLEAFGVDTARELSNFQADQVYAMKPVAEKKNIDRLRCSVDSMFEAFISQNEANEAIKPAANIRKRGSTSSKMSIASDRSMLRR
jgi:hypothetical protein